MPTPSPAIVHVLDVFAVAFTRPTFDHAVTLIAGTLLASGRRTVTAALRAVGLRNEQHFTTYHRALNRAVWSPLVLSHLLLTLVLIPHNCRQPGAASLLPGLPPGGAG